MAADKLLSNANITHYDFDPDGTSATSAGWVAMEEYYGFAAGFLISWVVSVAASQAVFYLARFAGRPVVERFVPARALEK